MEITILTKHCICPAEPTQPHRLFLSAFDLHFSDKPHFQWILFYPRTEHHDLDSSNNSVIIPRLKHSLSLALTAFHPLAGRLAHAGDDMKGRIEIDCNDGGVDFVEASANFDMHELGDFWTTDRMVGQLMRTPFCGFNDALLWIQVTTFSCGGFTVSCSFHHCVGDGQAFWHFMKSWAELCTGFHHISSYPSHCRHILDLVPLHHNLPAKLGNDEIKVPQVLDLPSIETFVFHIPKATLTRLKELANEAVDSDDTIPITSFEALCGHFWQCITRARMQAEDATTTIWIPVNYRKRLKQPVVPDGLFGNMIHGAYAVSKAGDLASRSLRYAAGLVHESIASKNEGFIKQWLEEAEREKCYEWVLGGDAKKELLVGSSPWFPVYEVDFGWGKPSVVRPLFWFEGYMVVDPSPHEDGGVCLSIGLASHVGESLKMDPEFLSSWAFVQQENTN